jgi:hypothetical protein
MWTEPIRPRGRRQLGPRATATVTMAATAPTVLAAAGPFRTATGGYRLHNAFRFAVGRGPA